LHWCFRPIAKGIELFEYLKIVNGCIAGREYNSYLTIIKPEKQLFVLFLFDPVVKLNGLKVYGTFLEILNWNA
jgi:hypothetical protein